MNKKPRWKSIPVGGFWFGVPKYLEQSATITIQGVLTDPETPEYSLQDLVELGKTTIDAFYTRPGSSNRPRWKHGAFQKRDRWVENSRFDEPLHYALWHRTLVRPESIQADLFKEDCESSTIEHYLIRARILNQQPVLRGDKLLVREQLHIDFLVADPDRQWNEENRLFTRLEPCRLHRDKFFQYARALWQMGLKEKKEREQETYSLQKAAGLMSNTLK